MKEFLQAVLISLSLVFSVGFITNGFSFPKSASAPAMDMSMPGMDHGTAPAPAPVQDESMPHGH
jgi:hypothetical protein